MKIELTIPGNPQGKARARVCNIGGIARAYTPEKTASYESYIKTVYINKYGYKTLLLAEKPLIMSVRAFCPIAASATKKFKASALDERLPNTKKPDIDNIAKVICDALNQLAYPDDKAISNMLLSKVYSPNPRLEITIEEV